MTADRIPPGVRGTIAQRQVITIDHERLFRPAVLVIERDPVFRQTYDGLERLANGVLHRLAEPALA